MQRTKRTASAVVVTLLSLASITACGTGGSGDLASAKQLIQSCNHKPVNSYVGVNATGSGKYSGLDGPRLRALNSELSLVAACGGRAKVTVFTSSSASTFTLFEGPIPLIGATDQAKARRLTKAVAKVSDKITGSFDDAVATLDKGGSDIVAQLRLASEWATQLGGGQLRVLIETDGLQNRTVKTDQIVADPAAAAARFDMPDLPAGTTVTFAGIGEVRGDAPPTKVVDAVKTFYTLLCQRTGAERCSIVTEIAGSTS